MSIIRHPTAQYARRRTVAIRRFLNRHSIARSNYDYSDISPGCGHARLIASINYMPYKHKLHPFAHIYNGTFITDFILCVAAAQMEGEKSVRWMRACHLLTSVYPFPSSVIEPTRCRTNRGTSLGDRDELVCPKLAVVTPGNRLPIEETSDGCCSPSCIVHKDAWYVSTVYGRSRAVEGHHT